jgi:hypothetical protein
VRKTDLKLVQVMERCELRQSFGPQFARPTQRNFFCPCCRKIEKKKVLLKDKVCPDCGFNKA